MAESRSARGCYLAEIFAPGRDPDEQRAQAERVESAVDALADAGVPIRYLHSVFVPAEETAFHVFEAERPDLVECALREAGLEAERISPAVAVPGTAEARVLPRSPERPAAGPHWR